MAEEYGNIQTLIEVMNENGVEFVFFNPGIDNIPLLETLAVRRKEGKPAPRSILCLDEFVAMAAAHGAYMASGKPQVVSVHSELGVLQIGGALHNAQWGKVPVVFFTESLGPPQRTNWRGEDFDQGTMVRNFVKWDHHIDAKEDLTDYVREAFRIATAEPCGPVYLTMPRETLWSRKAMPRLKKLSTKTQETELDIRVLDTIAETLLSAKNPLIVTGYTGRNKTTVEDLIQLAETLGARVMTADTRMNFPNTHLLTALFPTSGGSSFDIVKQADVVLAIDYDMHYASPPNEPLPNTRIIHIDCDIKKKGVPLWGKSPDIQLQADSAHFLPALTLVLYKKMSPKDSERCQARTHMYRANYLKLEGEWRGLALKSAGQKPISAHWLSHCIDAAIDNDTIVVNQTISPATIVAHQIHRSQPGTLLSCAGGCIGWAPGAALGVKLAAPDKTVVALMGDGAFIYGCPESFLWSSQYYKAPFLAVIYDNQGYAAVKGIMQQNYTEGNTAADITSPPDYTLIAKANGAYGRMVDDPADLPKALEECLKIVRGGQTAVLDVRIEPA